MSAEHDTKALARLQEALDRSRAQPPAPTSPLGCGDRLVVGYPSSRMPEWLVLAAKDDAVEVGLVDDELVDTPDAVALRCPPHGTRAWLRGGVRVRLRREALASARRLPPLEKFEFERVLAHEALIHTPAPHVHEEAQRMAEVHGGRLLEPQTAPAGSARPPRSPRPQRFMRRAAVGLALLAGAILMLVRTPAPTRVRPGAYALRGPGELGLELSIDGHPCLARDLEPEGRCIVQNHARIQLRYRRDDAVPFRHLVVIAPGSEILFDTRVAGTLDATAEAGRERCEDGLCPLAEVSTDRVRSGTLWAVFSRAPLEPEQIEQGGNLVPPADSIPYEFEILRR